MWEYNYTCMSEEEYLAHYGVKGMKWDPQKRKKWNRMTPNNVTRGPRAEYYQKMKQGRERRAKLSRIANAGPRAAKSKYYENVRSRAKARLGGSSAKPKVKNQTSYGKTGVRSYSYDPSKTTSKMTAQQQLRMKKNRYTQPIRNKVNSTKRKVASKVNKAKKVYNKYSTAEGRAKLAVAGINAAEKGASKAKNASARAARKAKKYIKSKVDRARQKKNPRR